ncbi:transketolase family protein [Antarcticirhabdus aurantiaca]|uniref:Transketolase family protein n=1 Tax=Antarcticirhabdus aurantiaca TaxID=2606717 RepID=A0ACD4NML9_9HYPH|nr:transketolase C-terminal domain-containing protein [Antarcticirhabdus aurantiaca]WAJ28101.1 transketolase family protein [Jeongeuplla avenae]
MSEKTVASGLFDCRKAFAETLVELAREDARIVAVVNDSVGSSNLKAFQKEFPDRLINVGIAEQNMVGVSAGLANAGLVPFVCCASPFLTGRAMEQVKVDAAYNGYHIVLCGMSPGMAYGELGPTHHSIEDLPWMRAIHDLTVLVPADPFQTREAVRWAARADGPVFMRVGRYAVPAVSDEAAGFAVGRADELHAGSDVTIVATGTLVSRAVEAAKALKADGIEARVLNVSSLSPIDADALIRAAKETRGIVTAEEGVPQGGLGGAVAEIVGQNHPVKLRILGVTSFAPTGDASFLLDHFGLNAAGIAAAARELAA